MPKDDNMQVTQIPGPGTFQFSAVRPENLGATEYTLVTIVVDETSSVISFADDLLKTVKSILEACQKNPRAENLMVRLMSFNDKQTEIHGFKPLSAIRISDYLPFRPSGMTALYDATYGAVGATLTYAKLLTDQDFEVNGAIYVITDGMDNMSGVTPAMIADKVADAKNDDAIESMITVLVGLREPGTGNNGVGQYLQQFQQDAKLTRYVDVGDATSGQLARLAQFVSHSISSQSQALGTGVMSQPLTF
ncbi:VWA domain-containing protein [Desulfonema ishimotonii]|uniref:VWA domain-containing protein n=2 Tax=Desulfonema ishimotonii TaxID=45657 RepID=A0A401FVJ1_9BACT|nr:VWA domain-containing protein [Desulfonema ishimotonii]GBC62800.1 VWA domain-containing protein [Desulfonema ishimotonii]